MGRFIFKLPDVGEGTAGAEIVAWHVAVGDHVKEDQLLVDVMTDKATVEMTSPVTGTVLALTGSPGEMATVGAPLVEFELEHDLVKPAPARAPEASPACLREVAQPAEGTGKALAAPAVRLRAADLGIDLAQLRGTGPGGRVTHGDLDDYLSGGRHGVTPAPSSRVQEIKLTGLRRRIAEKMELSVRTIPHVTYVEEIDMTELEALRAVLNQSRTPSQPKLTLLPFFMRALTRTLPDFPKLNAHFDNEAGVIRSYSAIHIGIATETPDGLVVPVIRHAEQMDLWQAAHAVAAMAEKTRSGKATRDELTGSTFTITSLGTLGGVVTTPIINHPEVAIIGPNKIIEKPIYRDGQIAVRKMMNLSSSFDHRVVDGADAARFVQRLKTQLEHPALLFTA